MNLCRALPLALVIAAGCDDKGSSPSPAASSSSPSAKASAPVTTAKATASAAPTTSASTTPTASATSSSAPAGGKCALVGTWAGNYPPGPFPFSGHPIELYMKDDGTGGSRSERANEPSQEFAWKLDGDKFSFKGTVDRPTGGRYSCKKGEEGKYIVTFAPDCSGITLKLVSDECKGRGRGIDGLTAKKK